MSEFQQAKVWLSHVLGLPKDALHIYVGLIVFLLAAGLFRQPLRGRWPILAVIGVALAGEAWDIVETAAASERIAWWNSWLDVWNTCLWPGVLFLLARFTSVLKR